MCCTHAKSVNYFDRKCLNKNNNKKTNSSRFSIVWSVKYKKKLFRVQCARSDIILDATVPISQNPNVEK